MEMNGNNKIASYSFKSFISKEDAITRYNVDKVNLNMLLETLY